RDEAHGEQDQVGGDLELAARDLGHAHLAGRLVAGPFDPRRHDRADAPVAVVLEGLGRHRPVTLAAFLVRGGGPQLDRPVRPGEQLVLVQRRLRQELELRDGDGALAVAGADTVGAGVAAADHDHALAGREDLAGHLVDGDPLVLLGQELHREVHAVELAPRHGQVAGLLRPAGQHHRVEVLAQLLGRDPLAGPVVHGAEVVVGRDQHTGTELDALGAHLLHAAIDVRLLELEVRDPVAQQAADAVVLLEHRDIVARARQLLGAGEAGRAGPDHRDLAASATRGRLGLDPALFPGLVDDGVLDRLDADRVVIDVQRAGGLARRGADAAGELGEVVRRVQDLDRALPVAPIDQVVPVRDDVVDRTAGLAERDAAIHAAGALQGRVGIGQPQDELAIVLDALLRGFAGFGESFVLDESGDFSHRSRSVGVGSDLRFLLRALARRMQLAQRAPVLVREDLDEALARRLPVAEDLARPIAAGVLEVVLDQALEDDLVAFTVVPGGRIGLDELLGRRE